MSKCTTREFMGDWALDIEPFDGHKVTLYYCCRTAAIKNSPERFL